MSEELRGPLQCACCDCSPCKCQLKIITQPLNAEDIYSEEKNKAERITHARRKRVRDGQESKYSEKVEDYSLTNQEKSVATSLKGESLDVSEQDANSFVPLDIIDEDYTVSVDTIESEEEIASIEPTDEFKVSASEFSTQKGTTGNSQIEASTMADEKEGVSNLDEITKNSKFESTTKKRTSITTYSQRGEQAASGKIYSRSSAVKKEGKKHLEEEIEYYKSESTVQTRRAKTPKTTSSKKKEPIGTRLDTSQTQSTESCECPVDECTCNDPNIPEEKQHVEDSAHFPTPITTSRGSKAVTAHTHPKIERTLVMIRPDALKYKEVILKAMVTAGFDILSERMVHLSPEQVFEIFSEHYGSPVFPYLVASMTLAPILAISLAGQHVIDTWKGLVGPKGSLPQQWFLLCDFDRIFKERNIPEALLSSENLTMAEIESRYFFPDKIWDETWKTQVPGSCEYLDKFVNPTLIKGLIFVCRSKPLDPVLGLAEYLLNNNPYNPKYTSSIHLANS